MRMSFVTAVMFALTVSMGVAALADPPDFDDLSLLPDSYWNGSDGSGGFSSGSGSFSNNYNVDWGSWDGFAYSNLTQQTPPLSGWPGLAQYTAVPGSGQSWANYGIGYVGWAAPPTMSFPEPMQLDGAYFTNNNYAYYAMLNGDGFAKQFGGASGNDPDWFLLTIEGFDEKQSSTGTVDFYLADYRFSDNSLDYIVDDWTRADLSGLGVVQEVTFRLSSSDIGSWGMNTPAYFAMDTILPRISIEVDIRPGSDRNPVNLSSRGLVPVAILGSADLDVHDIDLLSLTLNGAEPTSTDGSFEDVNNDSLTDLILHFRMSDLGITGDLTELLLAGSLYDRTVLTGSDLISIVPPGDVNGDGFVDGSDLSAIVSNWGLRNASWEQGDLNADGTVGGSDYAEVLSYWGTTAPAEPTSSIPEPATCLLLCLGGLAGLYRRR